MDGPGSARLPADLDRLVHDLRGPLNAASMHLEVLKRAGPGDPAAKQSLETIQEALTRLAGLLPAAFAVVALERGPDRRLALGPLVEGAIREAGAPDVTLAPGAWPDVVGDGTLLAQALAQLIRNAAEASRGGASRPPDVVVRRADPLVTVIVRDWGPALPSTNAKVLIRLTPPADRAHRATGLLAVERIARLHGGTLEFIAPANPVQIGLTLPLAP